MKKLGVSVIGVGYVGLCTAVGFASRGYNVIASDTDPEKAAKINSGIPPFHEPGLQNMLEEAVRNGRLKCLVGKTAEAVAGSDLTFIAVGTPSKADGSIDLQFIKLAAHDIGEALRQKNVYHLVVVKSTVVPTTTQDVVKPILEKVSGKKCGSDFGLCMNPEFLRQGSAFEDTLHADRLVIGAYDERSGEILERLYRGFYGADMPPTIRTTLSTAELIKYASNAMLATKISFINAMANLCERIPSADVKVVAAAMGLDKRIGPLFLNAGLGYGGSCFPKDVKALIVCSKSLGYRLKLLEEVENVNKAQPLKAVEFCKELLGGGLKGKRIAVLGLAFKADTDDMREARAIPIINQLLEEGADVVAYDPVAVPIAKTIFKNKIHYAASTLECLKGADCCILVTEWDEFKKLKPEDFIKNMKQPALIDGRRIYNPEEFSQKLRFIAIGLGNRRTQN
ncbi:MAG: UDP-glucose/GDP-mannose dehydrogenase family protein [Candidatus Bathyarchaeota archaeon]|nr:UDP-glucose/GDP-mannose dehydrogenase family protein [Candidatus Bathyarchaeota archaeon]